MMSDRWWLEQQEIVFSHRLSATRILRLKALSEERKDQMKGAEVVYRRMFDETSSTFTCINFMILFDSCAQDRS
jgi:hypothetical protein